MHESAMMEMVIFDNLFITAIRTLNNQNVGCREILREHCHFNYTVAVAKRSASDF